MYAHARVRAYVRACVRACVHACMRVCMRACVGAYKHTLTRLCAERFVPCAVCRGARPEAGRVTGWRGGSAEELRQACTVSWGAGLGLACEAVAE